MKMVLQLKITVAYFGNKKIKIFRFGGNGQQKRNFSALGKSS